MPTYNMTITVSFQLPGETMDASEKQDQVITVMKSEVKLHVSRPAVGHVLRDSVSKSAVQ